MDIAKLIADIRQFSEERDWRQFHDPKNLAAAVSVSTNAVQRRKQIRSLGEALGLNQKIRDAGVGLGLHAGEQETGQPGPTLAHGNEIAKRERPDVVILDINLPGMDGLDVCRKLKGDDATKNIGIVLITAAYTSVEDASEGEGCGADEYVVKPFLREVLIHNVERLINK